ncbi:MAG TPA: SMI1/KNR4 family protein [Gallionellaceae bacterium]|nr:SMI1/KNR4 family protein [Gallionellaceae bacterium]
MATNELIHTIDVLTELANGVRIKTPPPDDSLIDYYQNDIGIFFSEDYKYFLKNASTILYGSIDPLIITADKSSRSELSAAIIEAQALGVPKDWLPICEDNSDYYCLTKENTVRFWTSNGMNSDVWPTLSAWIKDVWINNV